MTVKDGNVRLTGNVGSMVEKLRAYSQSWIAGVNSVDDSELIVDPDLRKKHFRTSIYTLRADDEIEEAIQDAIKYDPRVARFNIKTEAENSVLTLRGVVDNFKAKQIAEQLAKNTVGVHKIINRLKVRPPSVPSDKIIATNIKIALNANPYLEDLDIDVQVKEGMVTLSGRVYRPIEKVEAGDSVAKVVGVTKINNRLKTDLPRSPYRYNPYIDPYYPDFYHWDYFAPPGSPMTLDEELELNIHDELWWSPLVDADQVNVSVLNGTATLTGTVDSSAEREAAAKNAYDGGARSVRNQLEVKK